MKMMSGTHSNRLLICIGLVWLSACLGSVAAQDSAIRPKANSDSANNESPAKSHAQAPQEPLTPAQEDAIQIQMDTQGPIFVYDLSGGFRMAAPTEQKPIPKFQLFADGKIVARGGNPPIADVETKLTETELIEFLNFVVNQNEFYGIDMATVAKQMESIQPLPKIADAPTSRFSINLQKGKKEIEAYALFHSIRGFPEVEALQQLARIERRCNRIVSKVHLADDGPYVLQVVNDAIAKQKPDFAPVTMKELRLATRFANGKLQVSFERVLPEHDGGPGRKANVIFYRRSKDIEPVVKFYGFPQK